ncbi:NAD(P)H-dependent oxidoreductase [Sphingomonas sp. H39-1-10]|uniref:NAD(P)H-dependent oxidoreductase n=1 Tax=Sphingomonas pollutisoli TaxID=3030829 RepID=UPI0023BA29B1|nr:NAD(P)H-dependent oxidoreductase [Sphingomonas pollutisoli]MDF0487542.1 NAD(P)H-dependent oxidoreductase [Sphingomonas pollutisoli]
MKKRLLVIDGHPDADPARFVHALARRYIEGAEEGGHEVRALNVAELRFPLVASRADWENGNLPPDIQTAQEAVAWADHIAIFFPLWLGDMPALLKGFVEQVMRPGFAFVERQGKLHEKRLTSRTGRLIVTMGMPAVVYRTYYRAHCVKSFERNILRFVGIRPLGHVLIGNVEGSAVARAGWLDDLFDFGEAGI